MSIKVKRGLGLVVAAVLALIVGNLALALDAERGVGQTVQAVIGGAAFIAMFGCALAGLVLIAWGLLRD